MGAQLGKKDALSAMKRHEKLGEEALHLVPVVNQHATARAHTKNSYLRVRA
jgi:hypothetical protein